ncbi:MAG: CHAD domain-containing protein [Chloroflexota bacterium]
MTTPLIEESKPDANQLLLEALENRWKNYRAELKRCRAEFSNEAVHDLRVAARRMLALIQLLNSISPRPRLQKLSRAFKEQLDEFDDLRDTQVILAEISEILHDLPQLHDFQKHLQFSEERMLRTLRKRIKNLETSEVTKRIRKTYEAVEAEMTGDLESQIMQAVDDVYLITKQRYNWVDYARPATIHRVRIAFKSFRYMVEIVYPLLSDFPMEALKRMNDYQSLMGEIQDAEVFDQTLADFSEHASFADLEPVRRYYEHRHADAISAYSTAKDQLDTFWRPAPEKPFPWEKTE